MLLVLVLLSALNSSSSAPAAVSDTAKSHIPLTVFRRQVPGCADPTRYRSTQDIVWSCLATIFACTWVAVHPNLPGPYDSRFTRLKRKLLTMIYAAIAPEMMMWWAIRQWREARQIADKFNKANEREEPQDSICNGLPWHSLRRLSKWLMGPGQHPSKQWTQTHGFFIQMGGFILFEGDTPKRVLAHYHLQDLIDKGAVDVPTIREDEIRDKSKGDFLTKLFVVLQTTWFVIQCLARWASHLSVTELEVVTLAFAVLNAMTYWFWWDKPQNVLVAVAVPLKTRPDDVNSMGEDGDDTLLGEKESWVIWKVREEVNKHPWTAWLGVPLRLIMAILRPFKKVMESKNYGIRRGSLRVPMFYAERSDGIESLALLIAPLFGALHLIPWSSSFPSSAECWLWRSSALLITVEPALAIIMGLIESRSNWLFKALHNITLRLAVWGLPLYVLTRLILLTLAFTTLRHLPLSAHILIDWMTFVPHI